MILAVALVSATATGIAGAATRTAVLHDCPTVAAAGRTWRIEVYGVACADARALVRKLSPKVTAPGVVQLGTYLTMRCIGMGGVAMGNTKSRGITCTHSARGWQVFASGK